MDPTGVSAYRADQALPLIDKITPTPGTVTSSRYNHLLQAQSPHLGMITSTRHNLTNNSTCVLVYKRNNLAQSLLHYPSDKIGSSHAVMTMSLVYCQRVLVGCHSFAHSTASCLRQADTAAG